MPPRRETINKKLTYFIFAYWIVQQHKVLRGFFITKEQYPLPRHYLREYRQDEFLRWRSLIEYLTLMEFFTVWPHSLCRSPPRVFRCLEGIQSSRHLHNRFIYIYIYITKARRTNSWRTRRKSIVFELVAGQIPRRRHRITALGLRENIAKTFRSKQTGVQATGARLYTSPQAIPNFESWERNRLVQQNNRSSCGKNGAIVTLPLPRSTPSSLLSAQRRRPSSFRFQLQSEAEFRDTLLWMPASLSPGCLPGYSSECTQQTVLRHGQDGEIDTTSRTISTGPTIQRGKLSIYHQVHNDAKSLF